MYVFDCVGGRFYTQADIIEWIESSFEVKISNDITILIAAIEESYSCSCSSAYFLFRKNSMLWEVHGFFDSAYPILKEQWEPQKVSEKYLLSKHWHGPAFKSEVQGAIQEIFG